MKIGLCGTISVGKTTLVNALKELPEFAGYEFKTERSKYLMELGIPLNTDSTTKGQAVFLAERASELMQENIIKVPILTELSPQQVYLIKLLESIKVFSDTIVSLFSWEFLITII